LPQAPKFKEGVLLARNQDDEPNLRHRIINFDFSSSSQNKVEII
jgi:hypothetical protein